MERETRILLPHSIRHRVIHRLIPMGSRGMGNQFQGMGNQFQGMGSQLRSMGNRCMDNLSMSLLRSRSTILAPGQRWPE
jgi:hypothetical protein